VIYNKGSAKQNNQGIIAPILSISYRQQYLPITAGTIPAVIGKSGVYSTSADRIRQECGMFFGV